MGERCSLPNSEDVRRRRRNTHTSNKEQRNTPRTHPIPVPHCPTSPASVPQTLEGTPRRRLQCSVFQRGVCVRVVSVSRASLGAPSDSCQIPQGSVRFRFWQIQSASNVPTPTAAAAACPIVHCARRHFTYVRVTRHVCVLWGGRNSCAAARL